MQPTEPITHDIDSIVAKAIEAYVGDVSSLPRPARTRIFEVYQTFFKAYLNIGKIKGISKQEVVEKIVELDQELIDYMQHFFSDYQPIYRSFISLNRLARELLELDGTKYPQRYKEKVDALISGQKQFRDELVFNQLHSNHETDK